jgi:hypothetical protein
VRPARHDRGPIEERDQAVAEEVEIAPSAPLGGEGRPLDCGMILLSTL